MRALPLAADDALALWERGQGMRPVERAELLLGQALPGSDAAALRGLSVGEQQGHLLRLLSASFGDVMEVAVECEECGETLELSLDVERLLGPRWAAPLLAEVEVEAEGYRLRVRPLRADDLRAAAECGEREAARRLLTERAVVRADLGGRRVAAGALPEAVLARVGEAVAALDPAAELVLTLECPSCDAPLEAEVDAAGLLWAELGALATRLLREVHTLAAAYGWSEREVLRMTPWRRAAYLRHVEA